MQKCNRNIVRIPRDPFVLRQFNNCMSWGNGQTDRRTEVAVVHEMIFECVQLAMSLQLRPQAPRSYTPGPAPDPL